MLYIFNFSNKILINNQNNSKKSGLIGPVKNEWVRGQAPEADRIAKYPFWLVQIEQQPGKERKKV
jgi:hypothetical protein